ncbi:MAG: hypothetical protein PHO32_07015 [Candidatus Cloacimonetes bacterium]|nr:hypothetical protein [Candidatus Cloacimonadota bacterium]
MDITTTDTKSTDLEALTDEELLAKYENAPDDSEEFLQVKAILASRDYSFEANEKDAWDTETDEASAKSLEPFTNLRYSAFFSLIWEIIFAVFAIAGATYFLIQVNSTGMKITNRTIVTTCLAVLVVSSTGLLVGGFRRLANLKDSGSITKPKGIYYILMFLWSLCIAGGLYYTVKIFLEVVQYSFKYAMVGAIAPLMGALLSFAYCTMFYILSKEV